jgi:branched-chain amino acid transport system permease protein
MSGSLLFLQVLNGLQFGLILFLITAGLTLIFGVMDLVNLAHGVQYMLGAYFAATITALTGSFFIGAASALPAALLVGLLLEFLVFRHLYGRSHLHQVLATFGLVLVLSEGAKAVWGAAPLNVSVPELLSGSIEVGGGLGYPVYRLVLIAAGLAVAAGLFWVVNFTKAGMLIRAGAADTEMVASLGINIKRLFMLVFAVGAMLAGFAGALMAPILNVDPSMGDNVLILAFVVIVIGGTGSIRGALVAALLVGLVDTVGRFLAPIALRLVLEPALASQAGRALSPMLIYILMAAVLFWRPSGLFAAR